MNNVRDAETQNELVHKHASYRHCLSVLQCVHLNVFGEVIDDCHNVSITTLRGRNRFNNFNGYVFKWHSRVNRSKCFATAKVSFVPIASRAFLSPVLNVITKLQAVKTLFEIFKFLEL